MCAHRYIGRLQQQVSEGRVVFGGEDVVLGVDDVQTQRAELLYLHRLPPVLPGLQEVPGEEQRSDAGSDAGRPRRLIMGKGCSSF